MPNVNVTYADMQSAADQLRSGQQQITSDLGQAQEPDRQPRRQRVRHGFFQQAVRGGLHRVQHGRHQDDRGPHRHGPVPGCGRPGVPGDGHPARRRSQVTTSSPGGPLPRLSAAAACRQHCRVCPTEGMSMRVALTVVAPAMRRTADVLLEADPATPMADIAAELASSSPAATWTAGPRRSAAASRGRGCSGFPGRARMARSLCPHRCPGAEPLSVPLYVNHRQIPPQLSLAQAGIRDGAVVSLGDPDGCVSPEQGGLVEVRVMGGPRIGAIWRLGAGQWDIGSGHGAVRLAIRPSRRRRCGSLSTAGAVARSLPTRASGPPSIASRSRRPHSGTQARPSPSGFAARRGSLRTAGRGAAPVRRRLGA